MKWKKSLKHIEKNMLGCYNIFNKNEGEMRMLEKIKNLGNLPLVIILIVVVVIAIVLSVLKAQNSEETSANTNVSDVNRQEELEETAKDEETEEIFEENVQEIVDETEEEEEYVDAKYFIRVNYGQNVVTIYTKDSNGEYTVPYKAMVCSTGTATPRSGTYTMPSGTYSRGTWGMMIGGVWAQYFTRIKGSILFHSVPYTEMNKWSLEYWEYDKLGTAASAGCIRLTVIDAKWIYNNCPAGTKVEFYTDSNPGPLGKPTAQKISEEEAVRGWDPTDPDASNPWKTYTPSEKEEEETEEPEESTTTTNTPTTNKPSTTTKPSTSTTPDESTNQGNGSGSETTLPNEGNNSGSETTNPSEGDNSENETTTPGEGDTSGENQEGSGTTGGETANPGEEETPNPDEGGTSDETTNPGGETTPEPTSATDATSL